MRVSYHRVNSVGLGEPMKPAPGCKTMQELRDAIPESQGHCLYGQSKIDGVRVRKYRGKFWTKSGALVANENLQKEFAYMPDGLDGDMVVYHDDICGSLEESSGLLRAKKKPIIGLGYHLKFCVYDLIPEVCNRQFDDRYEELCKFADHTFDCDPNFRLVKARLIDTYKELKAFIAWKEVNCEEGAIFRDPHGMYCSGRVGKGGLELMRYKFWVDREATLREIYCGHTSITKREDSPYGFSRRSYCQDDMRDTDIAATIRAFDYKLNDDVLISLSTMPIEWRKRLWRHKAEVCELQPIVMYKCQKNTTYLKPRHPTFRCFRSYGLPNL